MHEYEKTLPDGVATFTVYATPETIVRPEIVGIVTGQEPPGRSDELVDPAEQPVIVFGDCFTPLMIQSERFKLITEEPTFLTVIVKVVVVVQS
jgi:hypothetical protein